MVNLDRNPALQMVRELICSSPQAIAVGGRTKAALTRQRQDIFQIEARAMRGILEYRPSEFTFSALAGTSLKEVENVLGEHGQYLPFDPPFVEKGATLGGTVAAGLSGSGRYRWGGVRDFILEVQYLDGMGELVRGGGKVVKNAAGFDLPKLMVGSLGSFGVLSGLTFKVFPQPAAFCTLQADYDSLQGALDGLSRLAGAPVEIHALDINFQGSLVVLLVRISGRPNTFPSRIERIQKMLGRGLLLDESQDKDIWGSAREFNWLASGHFLVKVPVTPYKTIDLDAELAAHQAQRRYCAGANLAWIGWPGDVEALDTLLNGQSLAGLVLSGECKNPRLGSHTGKAFERRVKSALDPSGRWWSIDRESP
jgi:glycolate oxidase FAD binding subunit